ncbi:TPA: hypothetical protein P1J70_001808 [Clostridioides difficile]|uniref:DUF7167 family protein n=1 Tax=Clostridioides difficile TaxID=1496 RepID=UPI00093F8743|nr:hypothetical protein [Clostridioides difficile]EGT3735137.1 hypothetical protein [Clostridioides difficile]EGT5050686.1 hypothetical protein [Clostridioides difficile]EGT5490577.1 hypothetical protein [Clostridioides difficile]EGT5525369.1 hypothetical protein [Clostridioides difficile]EGT5560731.1 hypothetical protein [Clostridioides difficile]
MIICVMVKTNKKGSYRRGEIKVDDDYLKSMSDEEASEHMRKIAQEYICKNLIDWYWFGIGENN